MEVANQVGATGFVDYTLNLDLTFGVNPSNQFFVVVHEFAAAASVKEIVERVAESPAPTAGTLGADVALQLTINDSESFLLKVSQDANTADVQDLVDALNDSLNMTLAGSSFAGSVVAEDRSGTLAFISQSGEIHSLQLQGGQELGFAEATIATGPIRGGSQCTVDCRHGLELGFVEMDLDGGAIWLDAVIYTAADHGVDSRLDISELGASSAQLKSQIVQATAGEINLTLPLNPNLSDLLIDGSPTIRFVTANPFKADNLPISTDDLQQVDDLNAQAVSAFIDGLQSLASLGDQIDTTGEMSVQLPLIDQSLGELVDVGGILNQALVQPLAEATAGYLSATSQPTRSGIEAALQGIGGTYGELTILPPTGVSSSLSADGDRVEFSLQMTAQQLRDWRVNLGDQGLDLGVLFLDEIPDALLGTFVLDLTFGVDLNALPGEQEAFFVRFNQPATVDVAVQASTTSVDGVVGVLGVQADLTNVLLDASLSIDLNSIPSGANVTGAELKDTTADQLVTLSSTGNMIGGSMPISVLSGVSGFAGGASLGLSQPAIFDGGAVECHADQLRLDRGF